MRYSNRPKRIVRLTESDLTRIIRRVILEEKGRYKGEGEAFFETREEYNKWLSDREEAKNDQSNYYDDEGE